MADLNYNPTQYTTNSYVQDPSVTAQRLAQLSQGNFGNSRSTPGSGYSPVSAYTPPQFGMPTQEVPETTSSKLNAFGKDGYVIPGLQALTGLGNLALGSRALKQGREQFDYNKALTNVNLANQAKLTNQQQFDRYAARQAQAGSGSNTAGYAGRLAQFKAENSLQGTV
jgi:hypothetical protein